MAQASLCRKQRPPVTRNVLPTLQSEYMTMTPQRALSVNPTLLRSRYESMIYLTDGAVAKV